MNRGKTHRALIAMAILSLVPALVRAQSQFTGIYTFNCDVEGCAANQPALLAQGTDGNLYGTLPSGAASGSWLEYNMSAVPILTNFAGYSLTQVPHAISDSNSGFTLGIDGNLYAGVSHVDGNDFGAIIRLAPSWPGLSPTAPPTIVYTFPGGTNSAGFPNPTYPVAPPVQGTDFNLYGVTSDDGNAGYVYQVLLNTSTGQGSAGWLQRLPSESLGPLLLGSDGNFYGTYVYGSFSKDPTTGALIPSGGGHGGIFQITPAGTIGWYYNLDPFSKTTNNGNGDGSNPQGGLLQAADGYLYGTGSGGTGATAGGVVFKIALNGSGYNVVHNFQTAEGTIPHGGLVQGSDGYLYGLTTQNGPPTTISGAPPLKMSGTLFKVSTANTGYTVLIPFFGIPRWGYVGPGMDPEPTIALHTNGIFYGLTHTGGLNSGLSGSGAYDDAGEFFSYSAGLAKFISIVGRRSAHVGDRVGIIGQGFSNPVGAATGVTFGGVSVPWTKANVTIWSDHYITVVVPSGAKSGPVTVQETTGSFSTLYNFTISCSGLTCLHLP